MMRGPVDTGTPDRLFTVLGGRSHPSEFFDVVTLIVSECRPTAWMPSEHRRILELCRHPTAVVEISAELKLPVTAVRILLGDLRDAGRITPRHPRAPRAGASLPDTTLLEKVLHGLRRL
ncbi:MULTISPECIES: DUF742 domain-containing protein [unclassified Streptomyces]|uniref:DUF742 domain-containing protein n=1 Tax=unclassified Streptomyces TaxID=2593676 RepID=UPI0035DC746D